MASETFSYITKQIWGKKRLFSTSNNISKNAQFSSWSWIFANVMKKCMYFLRKVHSIMRQYFRMIGCNVSEKGAFQLWKWSQLMKRLQLRKTLCICALNKKRLCFLKNSSKISYIFHGKYDIFKEKRAFFTIEGISSDVLISKLKSAFFAYITTNHMKILPHD